MRTLQEGKVTLIPREPTMKHLVDFPAIAAWISRTPAKRKDEESEREHQEDLAAAHKNLAQCTDDPAFIDACASLGQLGMSAEQVETIVHAMVHRRIIAFSAGTITDLGEAGHFLDGSTRGSKTYEGHSL